MFGRRFGKLWEVSTNETIPGNVVCRTCIIPDKNIRFTLNIPQREIGGSVISYW